MDRQDHPGAIIQWVIETSIRMVKVAGMDTRKLNVLTPFTPLWDGFSIS